MSISRFVMASCTLYNLVILRVYSLPSIIFQSAAGKEEVEKEVPKYFLSILVILCLTAIIIITTPIHSLSIVLVLSGWP